MFFQSVLVKNLNLHFFSTIVQNYFYNTPPQKQQN